MRAFVWLTLCLIAAPACAQSVFTVRQGVIPEQEAVFATVEPAHVAAARAQVGGTVTRLAVQAGDQVAAGQVIATVVDSTLAAQEAALDAGITGLTAQLAQARLDAVRDAQLIQSGAIAQSTLDAALTAVNVAASDLKSRIAARAVLAEQSGEGEVLAPVAGRVLTTQVTPGAVVLPGDPIATIAERNYVLRLEIPERHALLLHPGDPVRLDGGQFGRLILIYPQIQNGLVEADATAPNLGDYFTGARIEVWIFGPARPGIVIPARYIESLYGLDYVQLRATDGSAIAVPVQPGAPAPTPSTPDAVEILSGLHQGDTILPPTSP